MNFKKIFIILLVVVFALLFIRFLFLSSFQKKQLADLVYIPAKCVINGGFWRQLPDSCGDDCLSGDNIECLMVVLFGCDCGVGKCWNGSKCVADR